MWKNLCCAVDFGEPSRAALEQAADLARELGAELTVVHVVTPLPAAATDALVASSGAAALEAVGEEGALETWRAEAELRAGKPVRARLLVGDPARQVARAARESGHDLVVVGTHGRRGLRRAVMGSVAESIVRAVPCPVLVAHDGAWRAARADREEAAQYT
jgi:nucleotide-binding universal stress UspA family protein